MASGLRRAAEWLTSATGFTRTVARLRAPSTAILAYHDVVPAGEPLAGDASLHIDQRAFADQLDFLQEHARVAPLDDIVGDGDVSDRRPRVAITFDDAYRGALTAGLEELRARGLPATMFVPPGLLGTEAFWWDTLAPTGGGPLPAHVRDHALETLGGRQERVLEWAASEGLARCALPPYARPAGEEALLDAASYHGLTLGAHTWSHPNLARLPTEDIRAELARSKAWLAERAPRYVDWLAYPYGLRTEEAVTLASEHFRAAVLVDGGLARVRGRASGVPHALPRINVPRGMTVEGLAMRLAGLLE